MERKFRLVIADGIELDLTDKQRETLEAFLAGNASIREIAEYLGLPEKTVKSRVYGTNRVALNPTRAQRGLFGFFEDQTDLPVNSLVELFFALITTGLVLQEMVDANFLDDPS